jgi:hypothetical protein
VPKTVRFGTRFFLAAPHYDHFLAAPAGTFAGLALGLGCIARRRRKQR